MKMKTTTKERINGLRELAQSLEISIPSAAKLIRERKFRSYRAGHKHFFFKDDVLNGLESK